MEEFFSKIPQNAKAAIFSTTEIAKYLYLIIKKNRPDIQVVNFIDSFKKGVFESIPIVNAEQASKNKEINFYIVASHSNGDTLERLLKSYGVNDIIRLTDAEFGYINNKICNDINKTFITERYPAGHYYSALPSSYDLEEFIQNKNENKLEFAGIDLNIEEQLKNLDYIKKHAAQFEFPQKQSPDKIYHTDNIWFYPYDAIVLASIICRNRPERIIEIGSGFSTGVMLDINEQFFDNQIKITCVEPHPQRLKECLKDKISIIDCYETKLQNIDLSVFSQLKANDILFIDSSHVAKMNSDVLLIFSEILPNLAKNVFIHFHDIFNDFSYPVRWVKEKRCWNEAFFLRAFLQYNESFKIEFYSDFMRAYVKQNNINADLPFDNGSGSFWLKKVK